LVERIRDASPSPREMRNFRSKTGQNCLNENYLRVHFAPPSRANIARPVHL